MKKWLFICLFLIPINAFSMEHKSDIVAIVNDRPITKYDFEARKKIVAMFANVDLSDPKLVKQLNANVTNALVEEELIRQYSEKSGGKITDEEVSAAITTIEERNKMEKGQLVTMIGERGGDVSSFKNQIRGELLKSQIFNSLSYGISVSPKEVDTAVINSGFKDFDISAWLFDSKDQSVDTRKQMDRLRKNLTTCSKVSEKLYQDFATAKKVKQKLSKFDNKTQTIISDTASGRASSIYEDQGALKLVLVCEKKSEGTSDDLSRVKYFVSNSKMSKKAMKFMKDLKSKAYIKVFNE